MIKLFMKNYLLNYQIMNDVMNNMLNLNNMMTNNQYKMNLNDKESILDLINQNIQMANQSK